jgi:hypothetical protein
VRRLLTWAVVSLGIAALVRRLRRRSAQTEIAPAPPETDPADELRQKLAASRTEEETTTAAAPETPSVEERRAAVHEQGRSTLDDMRPDDS